MGFLEQNETLSRASAPEAVATPSVQAIPMLPSLSPSMRGAVVSGMRWTVWLAALALPCSFGTNIILTRTGKEAMGTFTLLGVYSTFALCFFFIGGDAVIIRFAPELSPERKLSFVASYFGLALTFGLLPFMIAGAIWPGLLRLLLGPDVGTMFWIGICFASPILLVSYITNGLLRATLDMRWAQGLVRLVTAATFALFLALFLIAPGFLGRHYRLVIWGSYLFFMLIAAVLGVARVLRTFSGAHNLCFFLPDGFTRFLIGTQQASIISFCSGKLDILLVLNFGGLKAVGAYGAILTFTSAIPTINGYFVDTLLPGISNALVSRNYDAVAEVYYLQIRILYLVNTAVSCGIICSASYIFVLLGPAYRDLGNLMVLAVLFSGIASPLTVGSRLLSSVGKPHLTAWTQLGQTCLNVSLLTAGWKHWGLAAAVVSVGVCSLGGNLVLTTLGHRNMPIRLSVRREFASCLVACSLAAGLSLAATAALKPVVLVATLSLFMVLAGYTFPECRRILHCFLPARLTCAR